MKNRSGVMTAIFGILAFTAALALITGFVFRNEIRTMASIEKVDDYGFYTMDYAGDYGFDEFLQTGASTDEALIQFVTRRILKGLPVHIQQTHLGCTTFNAVTPRRDFIFGRNFDMYYSPGMIVHTKPAHGYESISMVNLTFLGYQGRYMPDSFFNRSAALAAPYAPMDGINEKGLSIAVLELEDNPTNQQTSNTDITTATAVRLLLDKAATVDQGLALLKKYDMHDSANACFHYQIADAGGKSVIVEYVNNEMHVLSPDAAYQVCTNFYLTPGEKYNRGIGQDRYRIAMNGLKARKGVLTQQEGMTLLKAAKLTNFVYKGVTYKTQWSALYNNTQRSVDLCIGRDYNKAYHYTVTQQETD